MELNLNSVIDTGNHENERLVLDVVEDCNLKYFLIFDSTYKGEHKISNKLRHTYWFTSKEVKAGDLVVLYTRKKRTGEKEEIQNSDGTTSHFFFWGLDSYVWNNDGDVAGLMRIKTWDTIGANR